MFDKLLKFPRLSVSKVCYPYRMAFDIEVVLKKEDLPLETDRMQYTARHSLLTVQMFLATLHRYV